MRIVMIGPFGLRPRGTMSVRALPLAQALAARGHTLTLLLPPWQNPVDAGRVWEEAGVQVENLRLPASIPGWFHARLAWGLARRALALEPDVVHAFKPKAYAGLAHLLLRRRVPVVVDTDDWEGPGGWNDLSDYAPPLRAFFAWQERWGLRQAAAVTTASRTLQSLAWATGRPPESVFYLPNGVRATAAIPRPPDVSGEWLLLYTRFFEFDLERLWTIVQEVRAQRPTVHLLVVGQGFASEEERLMQKATTAGWRVARTLDAASDLVYMGLGTPENLPRCLGWGDVALYPFDDTLINRTKCPVKLLDLLAAGLPVVGDAVGQIAENIRAGENGTLVTPGDTAAFVAAVVAWLDDTPRRQAWRKRAAAEMQARLSWEQLAASAEAAYIYASQQQATSLRKKARSKPGMV